MSQSETPVFELPAALPNQRLESLDAFRGFTIVGMIFVIMVSGYKNLPDTFPSFGSAPVSTWKHAGEDFDAKEWTHWHGDRTYYQAKVVQALGKGKYEVAVSGASTGELVFHGVAIRHSKPSEKGAEVIAVF